MCCASFPQFCKEVIELVESVRRRPWFGPQLVDLQYAKSLIRLLQQRPQCRWCSEAIKQVKEYLRNPKRKLACIELSFGNLTLIVGYMQPSKAPGAFFEGMCIEKHEADLGFASSHPSIAYPARFVLGTRALQNQEMLGVFAEHFGYREAFQQSWRDAKAIYLVDRFQVRFRSITTPMVDRFLTSDSLQNLRGWIGRAASSERLNAASCWLTMHEHLHATGALPFHEYMYVKRNRLSAGYEETRVDLLSALRLQRMKDVCPDAIAYSEYILAERILAYTMVDLQEHRRKRISFDSVGSHLLIIRLFELEAISFEANRLRIHEIWPAAVKKLVSEFDSMEKSIANHKDEEVQRRRLLSFVQKTVKTGAPELGRSLFHTDQVPVLDFFRSANAKFSAN